MKYTICKFFDATLLNTNLFNPFIDLSYVSTIGTKGFEQEITDFVTFAEEILNGNLHFLCSGRLTTSSVSTEINK